MTRAAATTTGGMPDRVVPGTAITTTGLTREFAPGIGALDVDLEVPAGTVYGFLGPNGAGKSTTIRMLVGMLRPDRGSARVLGLDPWTDMVRLKQRVGVLTSDQQIPRHHSGRSVLGLLARLREDPQLPDRGALLAARFDLDLDRPGHELSLGNRQKIGLVSALAHDPELVIMDEPSNGLDPLLRRELEQLLREVADDGRTVLLSSHSLSEVERVADHVGFIRGGRLVEQTSMRSMVAQAVRRAITAAASMAKHERAITLTAYYLTPVSRSRLAWSFLTAAWATGLAGGAAVVLGVAIGAPLAGASIGLGDIAAATVPLVGLTWAASSVAWTTAAATGSPGAATGAGWAFVAVSFLANSIGGIVTDLAVLTDLSPWAWYGAGAPITDGFDPTALLLFALAILLVPIGLQRFRTRDLQL